MTLFETDVNSNITSTKIAIDYTLEEKIREAALCSTDCSGQVNKESQICHTGTMALQQVRLQVLTAYYFKLIGLCEQTASEAADERRPECQVEVRNLESA